MSLANAPNFYNPAVKTVQGANSTTFKRPDFNTKLTIPQLFEHHAKNSPDHAVFAYIDDDGQEKVIRFPEVYRAIQKSATIASAHYNRLSDYYAKAQEGKSEDDPPVIGILSTTGTRPRLMFRPCGAYSPVFVLSIADSISFYTFKVGLMYLGVTPFPISTRNSAVAVVHLVSKTGVKQMFVSGDPAMQRLAKEANEILAKDGLAFEVLPMPLFEDIYGPSGDEDLVPMAHLYEEKKCIILHSSGQSTSVRAVLRTGAAEWALAPL